MLSATRSHWLQEIAARHVAVDVYIVKVDEALIHEHLPRETGDLFGNTDRAVIDADVISRHASRVPQRFERRPYAAAAAKLVSSRTIAFFDHTLKP